MSSRRDFVRVAAGLSLTAALPAAELARRPLGKTGLQVSMLGLGGAPTGNLPDQKTAVEVIRRCYDLGVNYFDTAAAGAYGLSQARYGVALQGLRDKIVLATKTRHRTWSQAELDLTQSLANLKTDHLDLYQVHNVMNDEDIDFIFARRGVMEMIEKAKKEGKIRFVGVTGHTDPLILNKILARYPFDTILMPLSVSDGGNRQKSFEQTTLPVASEKGLGVIAMKTLGAGRIVREKASTVDKCLHYVWSLGVSTAIVGIGDIVQAEAAAGAVRGFRPLSGQALNRLRLDLAHLEPWKGTPAAEERYTAD